MIEQPDRQDESTGDLGPTPKPPPQAESPTAPVEVACPICHRLIPAPAPELCPHCQAPIEPVLAVLRIADLSLSEAMRDLRIGDLESVSRRLALIRTTSKAHRARAEAVQAMVERLDGKPETALARIRALRDFADQDDEELLEMLDQTEGLAYEDQSALALCCEHYNFALFQAKRGHFEESREAAGRALQLVPHHGPAHALLAKIEFALRNEDAARYHIERALAIDPSNASASRFLAGMGREELPNPLAGIMKYQPLFMRWIGPIVVVLILAIIALSILLTR